MKVFPLPEDIADLLRECALPVTRAMGDVCAESIVACASDQNGRPMFGFANAKKVAAFYEHTERLPPRSEHAAWFATVQPRAFIHL